MSFASKMMIIALALGVLVLQGCQTTSYQISRKSNFDLSHKSDFDVCWRAKWEKKKDNLITSVRSGQYHPHLDESFRRRLDCIKILKDDNNSRNMVNKDTKPLISKTDKNSKENKSQRNAKNQKKIIGLNSAFYQKMKTERKSMSDADLCGKAKNWVFSSDERKRRGLDCSVKENNKTVIASKPKITQPFISSAELEKEKQKRIVLQKKAEEEERKRKALEQRIADLEKKNKELQKPKKKQPPKSKGGSGSGFFISKLGHIITNEHVVKKCNKITIGDNIDRQVPARLIDVDRKNDLALLRTTTLDLASSETKSLIKKLSTQKLGIEIVPLATAGLMRSDDVELGEDIVVAGFPYGDIFSKDIKVTFGNVNSTKGVGDDSSQFQIQAPVQIGNSGGPIYDKYGNIVGVVVAQLDKLKMAKTIGSLPENVNFGIKASTVKQFLNSSGLPTKWAERNKEMSNKEISQIASKQTVMVVCHRE